MAGVRFRRAGDVRCPRSPIRAAHRDADGRPRGRTDRIAVAVGQAATDRQRRLLRPVRVDAGAQGRAPRPAGGQRQRPVRSACRSGRRMAANCRSRARQSGHHRRDAGARAARRNMSSTSEASRYRANLQGEIDGAAVYRAMAAAEKDPHLASVYERLAQVEERHLSFWEEQLRGLGLEPGPRRPSWRARTMVFLARRFGPRMVLSTVATLEQVDQGAYDVRPEAEEIHSVPDEEQEELALIYEAKGLPRQEAEQVAERLMADEQAALDAMVREELGLDPNELGGSPYSAAASSFLLFAVGAIIPLIPYFITSATAALIGAIGCPALGLFAIGALISLLTGRNAIFSGTRQLVFGLLAAGATFLLGRLIGSAVG